jgi:hypothetical protein
MFGNWKHRPVLPSRVGGAPCAGVYCDPQSKCSPGFGDFQSLGGRSLHVDDVA